MEVGSYAHRPIFHHPDDIPSNEESALSPTELPFTADDFDDQMEQAIDLMEMLGDAEIKYAINGLLSLTPDAMPVLGETVEVPAAELGGPALQAGVTGTSTLLGPLEAGHHGGDPLLLLGAGEPGRDEHHDLVVLAVGRDRAATFPRASHLDDRGGAAGRARGVHRPIFTRRRSRRSGLDSREGRRGGRLDHCVQWFPQVNSTPTTGDAGVSTPRPPWSHTSSTWLSTGSGQSATPGV